jgi:hypothetical protein
VTNRCALPFVESQIFAAELELEEGDVLQNKQRVWDNAESQAALFRAYINELREEGFDFDAEIANA